MNAKIRMKRINYVEDGMSRVLHINVETPSGTVYDVLVEERFPNGHGDQHLQGQRTFTNTPLTYEDTDGSLRDEIVDEVSGFLGYE